MKKIITRLSIIILGTFLLCSCSGISYEISGSQSKATIKVTATDGKSAESYVLDISKGKTVSIESSLDKGKLQIEFVQVVNMKTNVDDVDDYMTIDTIKTIVVESNETQEFVITESAEYMMVLTAIGNTSGTVVVNIKK